MWFVASGRLSYLGSRMAEAMNFYIDDSGSRSPDRHPRDQLPLHGYDFFGLGGVLVHERDEAVVREKHQALVTKWKITGPLHSSAIRASTGCFTWVRGASADSRDEFFRDIEKLVTSPQLTALACVVDRPGYNYRYRDRYGRKRWQLCKTAFHIVVERASKFALRHNTRLRVLIEKAGRREDAQMEAYFRDMRTAGQPFDETRAAKYQPLSSATLSKSLHEFRTKSKESPLMQLADLCLWPMCVGGYHPQNKSYASLRSACTLIDTRLQPEEVEHLGVKYSCFDLVKKTEAREKRASGRLPHGDPVGDAHLKE